MVSKQLNFLSAFVQFICVCTFGYGSTVRYKIQYGLVLPDFWFFTTNCNRRHDNIVVFCKSRSPLIIRFIYYLFDFVTAINRRKCRRNKLSVHVLRRRSFSLWEKFSYRNLIHIVYLKYNFFYVYYFKQIEEHEKFLLNITIVFLSDWFVAGSPQVYFLGRCTPIVVMLDSDSFLFQRPVFSPLGQFWNAKTSRMFYCVQETEPGCINA